MANYYGRKTPTQQDLEHISSLVLQGKLDEVQFNLDSFKQIHVGKQSSGNAFLFNHKNKNWKSITDYFDYIKAYQLHDEYGNQYSWEDFLSMVVRNSGKQPVDSFLFDGYYFSNTAYFS